MKVLCKEMVTLDAVGVPFVVFSKDCVYDVVKGKLMHGNIEACINTEWDLFKKHFEVIDETWKLKKTKMNIPSENVSHPPHYNQGKYEAIDVIKDWKLNFNLGNVIKYIARADYKGDRKENLEKALFYLKYELGEIND